MSINFIGVDAGGTRTRALLVGPDGSVVGRGRAEGATAWSSGGSAVSAIRCAVEEALTDHDPTAVEAGVIAVAGGISSVPRLAAEVVAAWQALGLRPAPHITIDVVAAYAAATTALRGLVLTAGTGAIAALVDEGRMVRRAGGRGWLVGDEGSAVWLGVESVRAALLDLDALGPRTRLTDMVRAELEIAEDEADIATRITDVVYGASPASLGRLAPQVVEIAQAGDPVATTLVDSAARHLAATAVAAAGKEQPAVVVLGGSVLLGARPISEQVRATLRERWPAATFAEASSGEAGAAALAIRLGDGTVSEAVLDRLRAGTA